MNRVCKTSMVVTATRASGDGVMRKTWFGVNDDDDDDDDDDDETISTQHKEPTNYR